MVISCDKNFLLNWYQYICPCDLGHLWNKPFLGAFVFHKHILFFTHMEVYVKAKKTHLCHCLPILLKNYL